jgi:hypothetical protein
MEMPGKHTAIGRLSPGWDVTTKLNWADEPYDKIGPCAVPLKGLTESAVYPFPAFPCRALDCSVHPRDWFRFPFHFPLSINPVLAFNNTTGAFAGSLPLKSNISTSDPAISS